MRSRGWPAPLPSPRFSEPHRILGLEGAAVLHRREGGWQILATSGHRAPESPEAAASTIELDEDNVLAMADAPLHTEDQRILEAFMKELRSAIELDELEAEVEAA
jgi:hypothetical protein